MNLKKLLLLFLVLLFSCFIVVESWARDHLILGIHPYKSPTILIKAYTPLADYLSRTIGLPVKIVISKNYKSHIEAVGEDKLDLAYMGPASYVRLIDKFGKKPLIACQEVNGKPTFQGKIIVRKDSRLESLKQLKGKNFAFGDPASTMSHLVPRYMLYQAGIKTDNLGRYKFLGSHDNVALSVLAGDYDAGAVKEAVFYKYESRGLRVLETTPALTEHNFVASNKLESATVEKLRQAFYALDKNAEGKTILASIKPGITAMRPVKDGDYENLREILRSLKSIGVIQ